MAGRVVEVVGGGLVVVVGEVVGAGEVTDVTVDGDGPVLGGSEVGELVDVTGFTDVTEAGVGPGVAGGELVELVDVTGSTVPTAPSGPTRPTLVPVASGPGTGVVGGPDTEGGPVGGGCGPEVGLPGTVAGEAAGRGGCQDPSETVSQTSETAASRPAR